MLFLRLPLLSKVTEIVAANVMGRGVRTEHDGFSRLCLLVLSKITRRPRGVEGDPIDWVAR